MGVVYLHGCGSICMGVVLSPLLLYECGFLWMGVVLSTWVWLPNHKILVHLISQDATYLAKGRHVDAVLLQLLLHRADLLLCVCLCMRVCVCVYKTF